MKDKTKKDHPNSKTKKISLENSNKFVEIRDRDKIFYGGNQKWFSDKIQKEGACGTIAAANITAYIAYNNTDYKKLYEYRDLSKTNYVKHMKDVYKYLHPFYLPFRNIPLGIWSTNRFKNGVEKFAESKNIQLKGIGYNKKFSRSNIINFIKEGLELNSPVAMIIGLNRNLKNIEVVQPNGYSWNQTDFKLHWVVITELLVNEHNSQATIKVSTWGGYAYLDLDYIIKWDLIRKKFIYFK